MSIQSDTTSLFQNAEGGQRLAAGQVLFSQGDAGDCMYAVQEGLVDLVVNGVVVETVGPGGTFGELALLDGEPRTSSAIAQTDCLIVAVDQTRFMLMIRQTPFFAMTVMRLLARRLRHADQLIAPRE